MIRWDYNLFIGDETDSVHVSFAAGDHTYIIAEALSQPGVSGQSLGKILESVKEKLEAELPNSLDGFVELVHDVLATQTTDIHSFVCVYMYDSVSYLMTRGAGELYVSRGGQAQRLLQGSQTASGYIQPQDGFLLTNATFSQAADMNTVLSLMPKLDPQQCIETITPDLKAKQNTGMIALCMKASASFIHETVDDDEDVIELDESERPFITNRDNRPESDKLRPTTPVLSPPPAEPLLEAPHVPQQPHVSQTPPATHYHAEEAHENVVSKPNRLGMFVSKLKGGSPVGKKVTMLVVVLLMGLLTWSVVSGNSRRQKAEYMKLVQTQESQITQSMEKAAQLSGVNDQKALGLIEEAKATLADLQAGEKKVKLSGTQELITIKNSIEKAEQVIRKSEKASYEEFYDMTLIDGSAEVIKTYVSGTDLAMLDVKNGKIYVLGLDSTSVETFQSSRVKTAKHVALHQGVPYFFTKKDGIYSFESAKKDKSVIAADTEWGNIADFLMYNGNIYLVDSTQNAIHKYLVAEAGYSEKKPYLAEGVEVDLGSATGSAVDSSIYVAAGKKVFKFTAGARDSFSVSIPDMDDVTFEDVYTNKELDSVYLMDVDAGSVFIVSKTGEFTKQMSVPVAVGADDLFVTEDGIYILSNNKIYIVKE